MKKNPSLLVISLLLSLLTAHAQTIEKLYSNKDFEQLIQLVETKEENASANEYYLAAQSAAGLYHHPKAIQFYQKSLSLLSQNEQALEGLADAYLAMGKKEEALSALNQLEKINKQSRIQAKKAALLLDMNRYEASQNIYEKLYQQDSTNVYFLRRLCLAYYKQKMYNNVIKIGAENPFFPQDDKEVQFMLADVYYQMNNNIQAIPILENILKLDSLFVPALSKLAYIHFGVYRNYQDAIVFYKRLNEVEHYKDPSHLKNLAICEYFTGDLKFAAKTLDSLTNELANDAFIPFYAGLSYRKLGKTDDALRCLNDAAAKVIPAYTADIFHHLGRTYALKREFEKAISIYKQVREYDPTNYQVLYDIAVTYEEYNLNRAAAYQYYKQFVDECDNSRNVSLKYAENRMRIIREELFFDSE